MSRKNDLAVARCLAVADRPISRPPPLEHPGEHGNFAIDAVDDARFDLPSVRSVQAPRVLHQRPSPGDREGEEQDVQAGVVEALADVAPRGEEESRRVGGEGTKPFKQESPNTGTSWDRSCGTGTSRGPEDRRIASAKSGHRAQDQCPAPETGTFRFPLTGTVSWPRTPVTTTSPGWRPCSRRPRGRSSRGPERSVRAWRRWARHPSAPVCR